MPLPTLEITFSFVAFFKTLASNGSVPAIKASISPILSEISAKVNVRP